MQRTAAQLDALKVHVMKTKKLVIGVIIVSFLLLTLVALLFPTAREWASGSRPEGDAVVVGDSETPGEQAGMSLMAASGQKQQYNQTSAVIGAVTATNIDPRQAIQNIWNTKDQPAFVLSGLIIAQLKTNAALQADIPKMLRQSFESLPTKPFQMSGSPLDWDAASIKVDISTAGLLLRSVVPTQDGSESFKIITGGGTSQDLMLVENLTHNFTKEARPDPNAKADNQRNFDWASHRQPSKEDVLKIGMDLFWDLVKTRAYQPTPEELAPPRVYDDMWVWTKFTEGVPMRRDATTGGYGYIGVDVYSVGNKRLAEIYLTRSSASGPWAPAYIDMFAYPRGENQQPPILELADRYLGADWHRSVYESYARLDEAGSAEAVGAAIPYYQGSRR